MVRQGFEPRESDLTALDQSFSSPPDKWRCWGIQEKQCRWRTDKYLYILLLLLINCDLKSDFEMKMQVRNKQNYPGVPSMLSNRVALHM